MSMTGDILLTYILLGVAAILVVMILANELGGPRKKRQKRRPYEGGNAPDSTSGVDPGPIFTPHGRRRADSDGGGHDDSSSDGGGGDGGGGGGGD
jgi:hypothetical protein